MCVLAPREDNEQTSVQQVSPLVGTDLFLSADAAWPPALAVVYPIKPLPDRNMPKIQHRASALFNCYVGWQIEALVQF